MRCGAPLPYDRRRTANIDKAIGRGRGFTLIELLIALAMLGLITLLLFSGLHLGSRAWESVEEVTDQNAVLRLAHGFLVRALTQIRPVEVRFEERSSLVFAGDAEQLEFTAPLSEHVAVSGLYILRLTLEGKGIHQSLILTRWLLHPEVLAGGDAFPPWEPLEPGHPLVHTDLPPDLDAADGAFGRTLLLDDVARFEVAYYGLAEGDTHPDWHEEWFDQSNLPSLVRIRLATRARAWPDLTLALPTQQPLP